MRLKSFAVVGTVGLLAIIGAVQAVRWACSWLAVALVCWGGWDIAEAAYAAPWIIVASTSGLAMSFYGMYEDNKRYKRSGYSKIVPATMPGTRSIRRMRRRAHEAGRVDSAAGRRAP